MIVNAACFYDISDVLAKFTEYAQNLEVAMGKDVSTYARTCT